MTVQQSTQRILALGGEVSSLRGRALVLGLLLGILLLNLRGLLLISSPATG